MLEPASTADSGLERLRRLADGYLHYLEVETFPGGCFFASVLAEVDMQPGAVRDRLVVFLGDWLGQLEEAARDAQREGDIDPDEDVGQLVFEIEAALFLANAQFVVARAPEPIERARRAIEARRVDAAAHGGTADGGEETARRPCDQEATGSLTGSGRMTTVSATSRISSAGMPTRWACSRIASGLLAW